MAYLGQKIALLERLKALPYAARIGVFGSLARGEKEPQDIDTILCFSDSDAFRRHPASTELLGLATRFYGYYDPFVRIGRRLITRSDEGNSWIRARRAREIWRNIQREQISLAAATLDPFVPGPGLRSGSAKERHAHP